MVETYHALGIRHMLMAYNCKNLVGDGCTERTDNGLSRFGVALIEEMNRVGMIVDATHTGYRTTMDTFEVSKDPVIFSHSNPSALWDIPRNIKDDQIKASVKSGGVICVNGVDIFLGMDDDLIGMMIKHMVYVAELVGPEYVGIGTDYVADVRGERGEFEQRPATLPDPSTPTRPVNKAKRFNPMDVHLPAYLKASGGKTMGPNWEDCYYVGPRGLPRTDRTLAQARLQRGRGARHPRREHHAGRQAGVEITRAIVCPLRRTEAEPVNICFGSKQMLEPLTTDVRFRLAASIGQRNTGVKSLCRRSKLQRFAGPFVEQPRHLVEMSLRVYRQVGSLGEVLSQQAVGVLIGDPRCHGLRGSQK